MGTFTCGACGKKSNLASYFVADYGADYGDIRRSDRRSGQTAL